MKKLELAVFVAILAVIGFGIFAVVLGITGNVVSDYDNPNCYDDLVSHKVEKETIERVPYNDEVCEDVKLKFTNEWVSQTEECVNEICDRNEQYCVEKNFWGNCIEFEERCIHNACTRYNKECVVKISNVDDESGTWIVDGYFWDRDLNKKGDFIKANSVYVQPMKSNYARWTISYNAGENKDCWYQISRVPTKKECENVIKWKNEPKIEVVTEYETERVCK